MEKFEELLENYLDNEQIEKKISDDEYLIEEEEKKNSKKSEDNYIRTIPISEFVYTYLGTKHTCTNLKHKGLKSFKNPYVVGIPNEFAVKNPDCIIRNEIIVVIDSYGNAGTYINPNLLKNIQNMEEAKILLKILNSLHIYDLKNVQLLYDEYMKINMKISELEEQYILGCELLSQLKKKSILREIRKYVKETEDRKIKFNKTHRDIIENITFRTKLLGEIEKVIKSSEEREYDYTGDNNASLGEIKLSKRKEDN